MPIPSSAVSRDEFECPEDFSDTTRRFFELSPHDREVEVRSLVTEHRPAIDGVVNVMLDLIPLAAFHMGTEEMPPDVRKGIVSSLTTVDGLHELYDALTKIMSPETLGDVPEILAEVRELQLSEL